jgi:hypothetical protein
MITIGDNYRITSDKYNWILETRRTGKVKATGEDKDVWEQTYHPNFAQVAHKIIDLDAKQAESLTELVSRMGDVVERLTLKLAAADAQAA